MTAVFDLTPSQTSKIRGTWALVVPDPELATSLFYGRLFQMRPDLRELFRGDMRVQGRKLAETLNYVVDHLDTSEVLDEPVRNLGMRHREYGVANEDYADVGEALIWTFKSLLGGEFDADAECAWGLAYNGICKRMIGDEATQ